MKTYKFHLIRCGVCEGQQRGEYIGRLDRALTDESRRELESLSERTEYPEVSVVVTNSLARCSDTARIFYPDKDPAVIDGFIEYDFGEFEGHTASELAEYEEFREFLTGGEDAGALHGETNAEFASRVTEAFSRLVAGAMKTGCDSVALVATGGVIGAIMASFALPERGISEWRAQPGCGYTLMVTPSVWMRSGKAELYDLIPETSGGYEDELLAGEDMGDKEFDPEEFRGFYTPEE
ncbi:MAG: histidine phosphatase family protein [Clostridia bacterium]|nr:histidine phosphatase family protein [Clostridia bacterium]